MPRVLPDVSGITLDSCAPGQILSQLREYPWEITPLPGSFGLGKFFDLSRLSFDTSRVGTTPIGQEVQMR